MDNVLNFEDFKLGYFLEQTEKNVAAMLVEREDIKNVDKRARSQREWLRELAQDIKELSNRSSESRFDNYDLMFMRRSFKTCWTLYRAIMRDKAELQTAYAEQERKEVA